MASSLLLAATVVVTTAGGLVVLVAGGYWALLATVALVACTGARRRPRPRPVGSLRPLVLGDAALFAAAALLATTNGGRRRRRLVRTRRPGSPPSPTAPARRAPLAFHRRALSPPSSPWAPGPCRPAPLPRWLPGTVAAPTPVSALLHAGAVNAGAILLIRTTPGARPGPAVLGLLAAACLATGGGSPPSGPGPTWGPPGLVDRRRWPSWCLACAVGAPIVALTHLVGHLALQVGLSRRRRRPRARGHPSPVAPHRRPPPSTGWRRWPPAARWRWPGSGSAPPRTCRTRSGGWSPPPSPPWRPGPSWPPATSGATPRSWSARRVGLSVAAVVAPRGGHGPRHRGRPHGRPPRWGWCSAAWPSSPPPGTSSPTARRWRPPACWPHPDGAGAGPRHRSVRPGPPHRPPHTRPGGRRRRRLGRGRPVTPTTPPPATRRGHPDLHPTDPWTGP